MGMSLVALAACGLEQPTDDEGSVTDNITISGKITSGFSKPVASKAGGDVSVMAITDYKFYCVTFEEEPYADSASLGSDGSFSLEIPAGVPFGCFINLSGVPVATVRVVDSVGSGFSNQSSDTLNLASSVDLGNLSIDLDKGEVAIPITKIADAKNDDVASALDLDTVHGNNYTLECLDSGSILMNAACEEFVSDSPTVFMRILKASTGSGDVHGLGVWASKAAFDACGSIDMNTTTANGIVTEEGDGFSWVQMDAGVFDNVGTTCAVRDGENPADVANAHGQELLEDHYAMSKLVQFGSAWNMTQYEEDSYDNNGEDCNYSHSTSVTFSAGSTAGNLVGNFSISENTWGACDEVGNMAASFVVRFKKQ